MTLRKRTRRFPRRADNRLLELVKEFQRLRRQMDVLYVREDRSPDWERDSDTIRAQTSAIVDRCFRIREQVTNLPARSPEGLRTKAWLALWETCDGDIGEGPCDHYDVAIAWSLARDIRGLPL